MLPVSTRHLLAGLALLFAIATPLLAHAQPDPQSGSPASNQPQADTSPNTAPTVTEGSSYGPYQPRLATVSESQFSGRGHWVLGVEQLFGWGTSTMSFNGDTVNSKQFTLLGALGNGPYQTPRLSLDAFAGDHVTLGTGAFMWFSDSDASWFLNPRLGLYFGGESLAFWPRFGLAFFDSTDEDAGLGGTALSLELPFVIKFIPSAGMTLGPNLYLPLAGKDDVKLLSFGITAGFVIGL